MVFLELKPNNPAIHKSINPSSCGMTVILFHILNFTADNSGMQQRKTFSLYYNLVVLFYINTVRNCN